jgi:hypothetical protein
VDGYREDLTGGVCGPKVAQQVQNSPKPIPPQAAVNQRPTVTPPKAKPGAGNVIAKVGVAAGVGIGTYVVLDKYMPTIGDLGQGGSGGSTTPSPSGGGAVNYRVQVTRTCTPGTYRDAPGVPSTCSAPVLTGGACGNSLDFQISVRGGVLTDVCGYLKSATVSSGVYSGVYYGAGNGVPVTGTFNANGVSTLSGDGMYECCQATAVNHVRITITKL